jgi:nitrite reductase/ring-hydroxylating ferredoxin subunit
MSEKITKIKLPPEAEAKEKVKEKKSTLPEQETARRDFLKVSVATGVGVCAIGAPVCAAVRLVTAPVFAEGTSGKFYPLTTLDLLTERPQKFSIVDDKKDAWTTLPQQRIGSLFLRKVGDTVQAFHSLCPHAGCMIQVGLKRNPKTEAEENLFYCPCHAAHFDLDGGRLDTVAPRDMDSLEVKVEAGHVFVKFENFTFGITEKRTT